MSRPRLKPGQAPQPPMQFESDPFVAGDPNAPGRPWWVRHRMRALLATMSIPLTVGAIAFTATWLTVQGGVKDHPVFAEALGQVRASADVTAELGTPIEPGFLTMGGKGEEPGTYEIMFSVSGPDGEAGVRVFAREDASRPDTWAVTFLDVGIQTHAGREKIVTLHDGDKPERFGEDGLQAE
ncbi:MAG: cytochrome c oxidase assembly factor Coa1 family protein [Planctomycetota bacterium]